MDQYNFALVSTALFFVCLLVLFWSSCYEPNPKFNMYLTKELISLNAPFLDDKTED